MALPSGTYQLPLPAGRRSADRQRRPGREQDRAGADLREQGESRRPTTPAATIGATNLQLKTSNGYSPHLFPEYITDWAYYYAAAPRPGFMSRFLVAKHGTRAPYWPTSPNAFGGQIDASGNGDLPGDIYRLIGGVVLRKKARPQYAGYFSSAFLLPDGTDNDRIIAAGIGRPDRSGSAARPGCSWSGPVPA